MDRPSQPNNRNQQVDSFISSYDSRQVSANKKEKQNSRFNKVVAVLGAAALAVTGFLAYKVVEDKDSVSSASTGQSAPVFGAAYEAQGCGDNFAPQTVKGILEAQGFTADKYTIISDTNQEVDVNEGGEGSFTDNPINSLNEYSEWINNGSVAANAYVEDIARRSGDTVDQVKNGTSRTVFVQFEEETVLPGNTMLKDGQVVDAGSRDNAKGDAAIIYVGGKACEVSKTSGNPTSKNSINEMKTYTAVGRAGCANPQNSWPIPKPQPQPNPQPKPEPTPEPTPPKPPTPPTPKDPSQDVNVNPNVPDQVRGPGTTPVGEDPGPAQKPVDSGNGGAPAPAPAPQPQNPPSGGGSGDVLPPPTQAPAPANDAPKPEAPAEGNPSDF